MHAHYRESPAHHRQFGRRAKADCPMALLGDTVERVRPLKAAPQIGSPANFSWLTLATSVISVP